MASDDAKRDRCGKCWHMRKWHHEDVAAIVFAEESQWYACTVCIREGRARHKFTDQRPDDAKE